MEAFTPVRPTRPWSPPTSQARGIHVDDVTLVVHADPPVEHKAYLHRSGRTARAGNEGTVVTLMTDDQVCERCVTSPARRGSPRRPRSPRRIRCCANSPR